MKILIPPSPDKHHYQLPPKARREFFAVEGTAIDAERYPILSRHWPGVIAIGGALAINDNCRARLPEGVRYEKA